MMEEYETRATEVVLLMEWEELLREISLHAAYVIKGLSAQDAESEPDLEWIAGADDVPLLKRLVNDAFGKLRMALRGYLLPEGASRTEDGGIRLRLRVVSGNDMADAETMRTLLLQVVAYYVLYRWFLNRDRERALWLLALYEDGMTEVKRLLHFRRGGVLRRMIWW